MKLRTLSCNKTLLRKDIFRFAPLWAIYLIGGLLVMLPILSAESGSRAAYELASTMGPFALINLIYAALAAQLLFGDLFNSRLCNAIHALPMRRETWLCTHIIAGLLYSIVPHLIAAIFFLPMLGQFGWVAFAWLGAMLMEYLFFFGVAVLCVFCTGNRFAQVAVYAILNFFALMVYWFVSVIYQPLLYGVTVSEEPFMLFCPVANMVSNNQLLQFEWVVRPESGYFSSASSSLLYPVDTGWVYFGPGEGWGYLGICAGIGVALLVVALLLYRRRKLECAGEFIAVDALKPVFAVVFALCAGGAVAMFGQATGLADGYLLFLVVGLVIGWFAGQMLLQRTVRVFRGKTFLHLAILGLALTLTVGLTALDPVGITRYVPENENVQTVEFTQGTFWSYSNPDLTVSDGESVEKIRTIHQQILNERDRHTGSYRLFSIRYTLESGRQVTRRYQVYTSGKAWELIQELYNTPQYVLGESSWEEWYKTVKVVYFNGEDVERYSQEYNSSTDGKKVSAYTMKNELLKALWKDGNAGLLQSAQLADKDYGYWVNLECRRSNGDYTWRDLRITDQAENCQQWIEKYEDVLKVFGTL
ncbi:MAG: hypothetical protein IJZ15_00125 [Oscillospiraceae bacterium]|nr:hypothetical protein [Oscillospiraceae bacterium]